ncbi:MAG: Tic20 family protein [Vulcanococcus sp.]
MPAPPSPEPSMTSYPIPQRLLGAFLDLLPLASAIPFGIALIRRWPELGLWLTLITLPVQLPLGLLDRLTTVPMGGGGFSLGLIALFVLVFVKVVRNPRVPHPIRFNVLLVIVVDLILSLLKQAFAILLQPLDPSLPFLVDTLQNTVFLGAVALVGFAIVQNLRGQEPEIPTLSEAVRANLF